MAFDNLKQQVQLQSNDFLPFSRTEHCRDNTILTISFVYFDLCHLVIWIVLVDDKYVVMMIEVFVYEDKAIFTIAIVQTTTSFY